MLIHVRMGTCTVCIPNATIFQFLIRQPYLPNSLMICRFTRAPKWLQDLPRASEITWKVGPMGLDWVATDAEETEDIVDPSALIQRRGDVLTNVCIHWYMLTSPSAQPWGNFFTQVPDPLSLTRHNPDTMPTYSRTHPSSSIVQSFNSSGALPFQLINSSTTYFHLGLVECTKRLIRRPISGDSDACWMTDQPKNTDRKTLGPQISDFWSIYSIPKIFWISVAPKTPQNV